MKRCVSVPALALVLAGAACSGETGITEPTAPVKPIALEAIGVDPVSGATIETNKDDYSPGEVVHVDGHGWAPGETVALFMTEQPDTHGDVTKTVQADSTGKFSLHYYDVQPHDLGVTFTLTATGQTSNSVAVATFTDNLPVSTLTLNAASTTTVAPNGNITAVVTGSVNTGGTGTNTLGSLGIRTHVDGSSPATATLLYCFDENPDLGPVTSGSVNYTRTFNFAATLVTGVYDVILSSYVNSTCSGTPVQSLTRDNGITVQAANTAPTLAAIGDKTVDEGSTVTFDANGTDTDSPAQTLTYSISPSVPSGATFNTSSGAFSWTPTDGPSQTATITVRVTDNGTPNKFAEETITITVNNVAPTATFHAPASVNEGSPINISLTGATDVSSTDVAAGLTYAFDCGSGNGAFTASSSVSCNTTDEGARTVKGTVRDKDGGSTEYTANVTINNVVPVLSVGAATATLDEGGTFSRNGSFTDPGTDTWTATVDYGDGSGSQSLALVGKTFSLSKLYTQDGTYTVTVSVDDNDGGVDTETITVTVNNVGPTINTPLVLPVSPVAVGSNFSMTWTFDDPGADTWTCKISWDQPVSFGTPFASSGKTCSVSGSSLPAGVYTVTVYVEDDDGGSDEETATAYIVVYDPSGGFVTGGGWINSPAGAYALDANLVGKANFGFVSKYVQGKNTPQGNTEFQFHAGNLNFKSTSYEWLVVAGTRAQYKGEGSIAGQSGVYGFMITAIDGGNSDQFRIKIWNKATNVIVYDNKMGSAEDSDAATPLGGGSIVVHNKK